MILFANIFFKRKWDGWAADGYEVLFHYLGHFSVGRTYFIIPLSPRNKIIDSVQNLRYFN